jgi:hypothetical protein
MRTLLIFLFGILSYFQLSAQKTEDSLFFKEDNVQISLKNEIRFVRCLYMSKLRLNPVLFGMTFMPTVVKNTYTGYNKCR